MVGVDQPRRGETAARVHPAYVGCVGGVVALGERGRAGADGDYAVSVDNHVTGGVFTVLRVHGDDGAAL
jgi:hypothetical protein